MENNKLIGLVVAWGAQDWIRPALNQALEFCDEVMVVVSPFGPTLRQYEDDTYNICKEYKGIKLLDYEPPQAVCTRHANCYIANHMLEHSSLRAPGNWIWILDADEFYMDSTYKEIKSVIDDGRYNWITIESKFFYINMQHYLDEIGERVFRIADINEKFIPTIKWSNWGKSKNPYVIRRSNGMFHYSMLTNTNRHCAKWRERGQSDRAEWHDRIYIHYDLDNEEYWTNENLKRYGIKSPWFNIGAISNKEGKLFKYEGRHPKFIEEAGLHKIKDFREFNKAKIGGKET